MKTKHIVSIKTKLKVESFLAKWKRELHLDDWEIRVEWTTEEYMTRRSGKALAWVECDTVYRRAHISINEKEFQHTMKCVDEQSAYGCILHELIHIFLADYDDLITRRFATENEFEKVRESTVEKISRLIIKLTK